MIMKVMPVSKKHKLALSHHSERELVEVVQKKIRKIAAPGWSLGGWTKTAQENLVLLTP